MSLLYHFAGCCCGYILVVAVVVTVNVLVLVAVVRSSLVCSSI